MKKSFIVALFILVIFLYGCKEEAPIVKNPITGNAVKVDDIIESTEEQETKDDVEKEIETVRICYDTDNGIVRWTNGSVFGFTNRAERFEFNDYCFDKTILIEYYCEDEIPQNRSFVCNNGCQDNHCL